jgi:hypothetical protein
VARTYSDEEEPKMNLTLRVFSILLIHFLIFSSCGKKDPSESQTAGDFSSKAVQLEKVYGVCGQPDSSCASIKIEYPEITKAPTDAATTAINHFIKEAILKTGPGKRPAQSMEGLMEQFIEEYKGVPRQNFAPKNRSIPLKISITPDLCLKMTNFFSRIILLLSKKA